LALAQPTSRLAAQLPDECPEGNLFEPYSQVCAAINDRRDWWLTPSEPTAMVDAPVSEIPDLDEFRWGSQEGLRDPQQQKTGVDEPPEAGAINSGMTYRNGALTANTSGRLHTKMFVYPEGLNPSGFLGWTFTPATNRVDSAVEVVGIYRMALGDSGVLSIFGRPCTLEYPCPDGDTSNGWQPSKNFAELECNITQIVDDGGHAQKIVHYANHSDRLDSANPPLWKNAVYLWNYCAGEWDLVWEHVYREQKRDCSVEGCYWWGPGFELSGDPFPRPQVNELGYEDTLLYHDGVWSELRPNETEFRDPEDRPDLSPWQLFHLDPNRSFGAGNWIDVNDPPIIEGQEPLATLEDEALTISSDSLVITDPDVDPAYHVAFTLTVYGGENYTRDGLSIKPDPEYFGPLNVPVTVSDGAADSQPFELLIDVIPVDDAPVITLLGNAAVTVTVGDTYTDTGATATDDTDGDITANIVTVNLVDTNTIGDYTVTYNVSDAAGNAATEVKRSVSVVAVKTWTAPQTGDTWTTDLQTCGPRVAGWGESWVRIQTWIDPQTGDVWTTDPRATGPRVNGLGCSWVKIVVWVDPATGAIWTTDPNAVGPKATGFGHTWTRVN
jgi:hypothetical protein